MIVQKQSSSNLVREILYENYSALSINDGILKKAHRKEFALVCYGLNETLVLKMIMCKT